MKQFTIYGGKFDWNNNEGMLGDISKETDKAYLIKTLKGEFWISKSLFIKLYRDNGMGSMCLYLPHYFKIKLIY